MRGTSVGINMNYPVVSPDGGKKIPLDIRIRDYVREKYNGLPENELRYILYHYYQFNLQHGMKY